MERMNILLFIFFEEHQSQNIGWTPRSRLIAKVATQIEEAIKEKSLPGNEVAPSPRQTLLDPLIISDWRANPRLGPSQFKCTPTPFHEHPAIVH